MPEAREDPAQWRSDDPFVLLDDSLCPGGRAVLYDQPDAAVACDDPAAVPDALRRIGEARRNGLHAAGYLSYELGYVLEPTLAPLLPPNRPVPLLWMGLFRRRRVYAGPALAALLASLPKSGAALDPAAEPPVTLLGDTIGEDDYRQRLERVLAYIQAGDVYQINFTFHRRFQIARDPAALYAELRRRQPVAHGALMYDGAGHVLSVSPELFLSLADGVVTTRPMKGTAPRGRTPAEDDAIRSWLAEDPKSRAENLMITDLMRNDIGRVAEIGSVRVPSLFELETFPTLHQMTSTVTAKVRRDVAIEDLLRAVFPCGSITGAPKIRAMQIIRDLELGPRGVYTGAIGAIDADGSARFNVAIRTLHVAQDGLAELGLGGGIVADSSPDAEWEECRLKGEFLRAADPPFALIETLLWTPNAGFYLLERHLDRLLASAAYFGFARDPEAVRAALAEAVPPAGEAAPPYGLRMRLTLDRDGRIRITHQPLGPPALDTRMRLALSPMPTDSGDRFLFHKTTRREFYDRERARLRDIHGCDEVLFLNERGELTEGSFTNLFIRRDEVLLTPPVTCGLLDGCLRRELLDDPSVPTREAVLRLEDIQDTDDLFVGNSVRGLVPAELMERTPPPEPGDASA